MKLDCQEKNEDKTQTINEGPFHKKIEKDLNHSVDCKSFPFISF